MAGGVSDGPAYKEKTLSELYDELCPMYMMMGMTYDEFWDKDATMVIAYRRAYEAKQRQMNLNAWLIGSYMYEAFEVAYNNAWAKNKNDMLEYPRKPRPLTEADARREREEQNRVRMERLFAYMNERVKTQKKLEAQENERNTD